MLVDSVTISIVAGDGGNGAATFRRDATTARGGPDGGDGGNGGNVYFQGSTNINDLREFRYTKTVAAENGVNGSHRNGFGKNAKHKVVFVPIGTEIVDVGTKERIEIGDAEKKVLIARGGTGGRGNVAFKSATNQTPLYRETGGVGERKTIHLELRLIADIGLIGLPNAGKSGLLAMLTNAEPKVADYPFTTLEPNIGMMGKHAIADIPGLIEGASHGKGLGYKFLRHIARTRILLHCISLEETDVCTAYAIVRKELAAHSPELVKKKEYVVLTKTDLATEKEIAAATRAIHIRNPHVFAVSIVDDQRITDFRDALRLLLTSV